MELWPNDHRTSQKKIQKKSRALRAQQSNDSPPASPLGTVITPGGSLGGARLVDTGEPLHWEFLRRNGLCPVQE